MALSNQNSIENIIAKEVKFVDNSDFEVTDSMILMEFQPISLKRRILLWLCCWLSCISTVLLVFAYSTQSWLEANPERVVDDATAEAGRNVSESTFKGRVNLGLVVGQKTLDNGLGQRVSTVDIFAEVHSRKPLISVGIWATVLLFGCLSAAWSIVTAGCAAFNAHRAFPARGIVGEAGLLLWPLSGLTCCLLAALLYLIEFSTSLQHRALSPDDVDLYGWSNAGSARLGHSFGLLLCSAVCSAACLLCAWFAGARPRQCCFWGAKADAAAAAAAAGTKLIEERV